MIARILGLSLHHRALTLAIAAALLAAGLYRATEMPVDVFPDLSAPRVTVVTESTGLAAEEVEQLITFPIESAVNGAAGVRRVRSASAPGISIVWVEFDWSTPPALARQRVTERLQGVAAALPPDASAPTLAPASSVMGEIAFVALTSDKVDAMTLRRAAEVDVRRRLLGVPGISQVVAIGGEEKQYQILLDPIALERFGLTLGEAVTALETASRNAPGGYLVDRAQESVIRVLGRAHSADALGAIPLAMRDGVPVRVRDVGEATVGAAVRRGTASHMAKPAVMLSIVKQPEADTVSTTGRIDEALAALAPSLAADGIALHADVFRQQDFIDTAVANVMAVLRDGALLVIVVLFVFLGSLRPTLISLVAIPFSVLAALLVMSLVGLRIDTMTLGGLAIAVGELVDDAIVDVENVLRRLRERAMRPPEDRAPVLDSVFAASLEIRSSIVSATAVIMCVFVPLLFLDGLEGRLLRPLAIAYLVAIFASLVVAVTATPVLCALWLPGAVEHAEHGDARPVRWIRAKYLPWLSRAVAAPVEVAFGALLLVTAAGAGLLLAGRSFLPEFNEGSLNIAMALTPGTSLPQSDALATMAERALMADPAVRSVGRRTGRAERDEHVLGVETSEFEVRLRPEDERTKEQVFADLRERLKAVPGATFTLGQPISHRIEHMVSGQRSALSVKLFGDDLGALRAAAARVKEALAAVPGLVDVGDEQLAEIPQLHVRVDPARAAAYGFSAGAAAGAVSMALWGTTVGQMYEGGIAVDVLAKVDPARTRDADAVRQLRIPTPSGAVVPVNAFAEVVDDAGPNYVLRENVSRRAVVTANTAGVSAREGFARAKAAIEASVALPPGVRVEYGGQFEQEEAATRRLLLLGVLALVAVAWIVAQTLGSVRRTLIVLVNLPLALAGGVIGVYLAGGVLTVATTIGFITLFGIAMRNGILLATRVQDLEAEAAPLPEAVRRAASERLGPILMTALTAALGLLPLALAMGKPGSEIQAPMALVILTGLLTSTVLNMFVVPAMLVRWGGEPSARGERGPAALS